MSPETSSLTVYYDGSCPLCRAEIALYRKQDVANTLDFRDVSCVGQPLEADLSRTQAMGRFHVRHPNGDLASGARAFVGLWVRLPQWRWAVRIAAFPGMLLMLEGAYRLFLPVRPVLAWMFRTIRTVRPG